MRLRRLAPKAVAKEDELVVPVQVAPAEVGDPRWSSCCASSSRRPPKSRQSATPALASAAP